MSKLHSSNEIVSVLKKLKFKLISQRGSHGKFKNESGRTVILPMNKKEIPPGTFRSILRQIGVSDKDFKELIV